jgi:hypothetical protein
VGATQAPIDEAAVGKSMQRTMGDGAGMMGGLITTFDVRPERLAIEDPLRALYVARP